MSVVAPFGPFMRPVSVAITIGSVVATVTETFGETQIVFKPNPIEGNYARSLYDGPSSALQKVLIGNTSEALADFSNITVDSVPLLTWEDVDGNGWVESDGPGIYYNLARSGGAGDASRTVLWTLDVRHRWYNYTKPSLDSTGSGAAFTMTLHGDGETVNDPADGTTIATLADALADDCDSSASAGFDDLSFAGEAGGEITITQTGAKAFDASGPYLTASGGGTVTDLVLSAPVFYLSKNLIRTLHSEAPPAFVTGESVTLAAAA